MVMAYNQQLEDHSGGGGGGRQDTDRGGTLRRPRSPSPFIATSRSRSLSTRRDSLGQQQQQQQLRSQGSNGQSNGHHHQQQQEQQQATRHKNTLYAGGQKVKRKTPDPTQVTTYREQRDAASSRMSAELPPIVRTGSATSASRRSSRDSKESTAANQSKPVPMLRPSDKPLISIDSHTSELTSSSPRNPPKRSYVSPGSGSGSQATGSSNKSNPSSSGPAPVQHKTLCAESEASPGPKLETLFERNGTSGAITSRRAAAEEAAATTTKPEPEMRRNTHSFTDIITLQPNNPLTASKRTKSQSNLSKLSENGQQNGEKRPAMTRYRSDTNLNMHSNGISSNNPAPLGTSSRLNRASTSVKPTRKGRTNGQGNTGPHGKPAPLIREPAQPSKPTREQQQQRLAQQQQTTTTTQQQQQNEQTLNAQNLRLQEGLSSSVAEDDSEATEDFEKRQRIHDWLDGVEDASVDHPPIQDISDEGPPQTDTAIHIVYNGD